MACSFTIKDSEFGVVEVFLSSNCKRVTLKIVHGNVVRMSSHPSVSVQLLQRVLDQNRNRIREYISTQGQAIANRLLVFSPETHFHTASHSLRMTPLPNAEALRYVITDDAIIVSYPDKLKVDSTVLQEFVHKAIGAALKMEALAVLPQRVDCLAREHGFSYKKLDFRNMQSKWGSCSSLGRICLNVHLMRLPQHLQDMVVLHELSHTVHMNHSAAFYELLDKCCNGKLAQYEMELKKYSPRLTVGDS